MSDAADDAQDFESSRRAVALAGAASIDRGPVALMIDGVAHCADCEAVIPEARLKAVPGCGQCVICAEEREAER